MATYPAGGYVADLTEYPDKASDLMRDLEANEWVDQYTRAVLVEFNTSDLTEFNTSGWISTPGPC